MHARSTVSLDGYSGSIGLLSWKKNKTGCIIFIHGYGGNPLDTWSNFHALVSQFPSYANYDLYFFRYNSVNMHLAHGAGSCLDFIQKIYPNPSVELVSNSSLDLPVALRRIFEDLRPADLVPKEYKKLVLVGHSEGGLLLRIAVLDAYNHAVSAKGQGCSRNAIIRYTPLLAGDLCLFAPAQFGSRLSNWYGAARRFSLVGTLIEATLGDFSPAYREMKEEPKRLEEIREGTETAFRHHDLKTLKARTLWGGKENVVKMWNYKHDDADYVEGVDHFGICKPTTSYLRPLGFVLNEKAQQATATA